MILSWIERKDYIMDRDIGAFLEILYSKLSLKHII